MATTVTALKLGDGAVVAPSYGARMFPDSKRMAMAIIDKVAPKDEEEDKVSERDVPEGLIAAAEDIMDVLSSYGPSSVSDSASKVEKATQEAARRAKAKMLASALGDFFDQYDAD